MTKSIFYDIIINFSQAVAGYANLIITSAIILTSYKEIC